MQVNKIAEKFWNSGTFTQWLRFLVSPLRLFLLTPLVLAKWDSSELVAFYLMSSVISFSTILSGAAPAVISPILVFFFAGVKDLSETGQPKKENAPPNWEGFSYAYATMKIFQRFLALGMLLLIVGLSAYALVEQLGWNEFDERFFWVPLVVGVQVFLQVLAAGAGGPVVAVGQVAVANRNSLFFTVLQVLSGALTVAFGGGLVQVLLVQLIVVTVHRLSLFRLQRKWVPHLVKSGFSREIAFHVKKPAFRLLIGTLSSVGLQRASPLLLAGTLSDKNLIIFSLALAIFGASGRASNGFITSKLPKLGKLYARGSVDAFRKLANERIFLSVFFYFISGLLLILGFTFFLKFTGRSDLSVPPVFLVLFWLLFLWRLVIVNFSLVYNVTNERPFYLRSLYSAVFTLLLLFYGRINEFDFLLWPLISITIPFFLVYEFFPFRKYLTLVGGALFDLPKSMFVDGTNFLADCWHKVLGRVFRLG